MSHYGDSHADVAAIKRADKAASIAHDFIYGKNGVTKQQASDAIWTIHNALRPFIPVMEHPDSQEMLKRPQEDHGG